MSHRQQKSRQRNRQTKVAALFDVTAINIALILLGIGFFMGYLAMNSKASTKGFAIRTAERTIAQLNDEKKRLDMEAVAAQSLQRVEEHISGLGMVQVRDVDYLNAAPPSVSMK